MKPASPEILEPHDLGLSRAADILRGSGLVAFPTETVYGLGADATSDSAVASIFAAKDRPSFNPLIAHVLDTSAAEVLVQFNDTAHRLAAAFWPGALTLVLPLRKGANVSLLAAGGLETLAVRSPDHPVARALLAAFGGPIVAPSANPSGRISPTTAAHVIAGLSGRIDAVLDGGACGLGVESTILAPSDTGTVLLREGGLPVEAIEACLGEELLRDTAPSTLQAPGQMASHYAPLGSVRLNATALKTGEVLLGFGSVEATLNLSPSSDLTEAAANLFAHLHELDARGVEKIAVSPIPETGLGRAINDRLRRAAAPR